MKILNLTQHIPTPAQYEAGVIDFPQEESRIIKILLTFTGTPSGEEVIVRAESLAKLANDFCEKESTNRVMIGAVGYLTGVLEIALDSYGIEPLYANTDRESVEIPDPDNPNATIKTQVFKHLGWTPGLVVTYFFAKTVGTDLHQNQFSTKHLE